MRLEAEVKSDIAKKLKNLESSGDVLWYERLQSGQIHNGNQHVYLCRRGTPDYVVVLIGKHMQLVVIFVEVKREGVFKVREGDQKVWVERYGRLHVDMIHIVAQSVEDMMKVIMKLGKDRVAEIEFNP